MGEKIFKPEWIPYTRWWHKIPLSFKRVFIACDFSTGKDYGIKTYYKILNGKRHIIKIEEMTNEKIND